MREFEKSNASHISFLWSGYHTFRNILSNNLPTVPIDPPLLSLRTDKSATESQPSPVPQMPLTHTGPSVSGSSDLDSSGMLYNWFCPFKYLSTALTQLFFANKVFTFSVRASNKTFCVTWLLAFLYNLTVHLIWVYKVVLYEGYVLLCPFRKYCRMTSVRLWSLLKVLKLMC